jgi:hypothetical protein
MQIFEGRGRRGWRTLIPRHSTVAAYAALLLAAGGTAAAATGASFLLGHSNTAKATSGLTNSGKGVALSLKTSSAKYAPLSVSSKALVTNLNANYLDGLPSSAFGTTESANVSVPGTDCTVLVCSATVYGPVSGASVASGTEASVDTLTPLGATLVPRDLSVQVSTAPGAATVVVEVVVNDGSSTPLGCPITGSDTTCSLPVATGGIPAGSRVSIGIVTIVPPGVDLPAENVMTGFILASA